MEDMSPNEKRLYKELVRFMNEPPAGLTVETKSVPKKAEDLNEWLINLGGFEGTLYDGEQFQLIFKFSDDYPFESPEVTFVGNHIPVHPRVYSNGHICLPIFYEDWSPAFTVESVCHSIIAMLNRCRKKKPPADNDRYVKDCKKRAKIKKKMLLSW